jgi:hypothetical protein
MWREFYGRVAAIFSQHIQTVPAFPDACSFAAFDPARAWSR